jgi:hypothetical protein
VFNAAKPPVWRAWLLLALACWACIAPGVALALPTASAPGFAKRGLETRVGVFCGNYGPARPVASSQVAELHQAKSAYGYETASGVHVYLYANADPVAFTDPSGYMALVEISLVQEIQGMLRNMSQPSAQYARKKSVRTIACVVGVASAEQWMDMEFSSEGHHPIPKSLGGAEDQFLLFLPPSTHRAFHTIFNLLLKGDPEFVALGLNNYSSAVKWATNFEDNPALKKSALVILKKAGKLIDKKCDLPRSMGLENYIKQNQKRWLRGG